MNPDIPEGEIITSPVPPKKRDARQLTFFQALEEVLNTRRITKLEWADENIYCFLVNEHLSIYINNKIQDWIVSEADMQGTDWVVLE